jgi:bifunctional oligoribonuclease and PAP phosphatase NrnA
MESYVSRQILQKLTNAQHPVLICDERIDGDSLGSALAVVDYLKLHHSIFVPVYVSEEIPQKYRFLSHIEHCTTDKEIFNNAAVDVVVSFDCSDEHFIQGLIKHCPNKPLLINIDHHASNALYGEINLVMKDAPATAEVVHRFFRNNNIEPSREAATALLMGICFDTMIFSHDGTNQRAFNAASELMKFGARSRQVVRAMMSNRTIPALRVWGKALERVYKHPFHDMISTCVTRKDIEEHGVSDEEIDGLTNFLHFMMETDTLFFIRETTKGDVKVSMRTISRDVSRFARAMGGGGHMKAAGFTIPNSTISILDNGSHYVTRT